MKKQMNPLQLGRAAEKRELKKQSAPTTESEVRVGLEQRMCNIATDRLLRAACAQKSALESATGCKFLRLAFYNEAPGRRRRTVGVCASTSTASASARKLA